MSEEKYQGVEIGKYLVADPSVGHGQPTFRGTRVLVHRVIKRFRRGKTLDEVAAGYRIPREAVVEGLYLAAEALWEKYSVPYPEPPSMEELLKGEPIQYDEQYQRVEIGKYTVADPYICHGQPTVRRTRVLIHIVIKDFSTGETVDEVAAGYKISRGAVIEGLSLAAEALLEKYAVPDPELPSMDKLWKLNRVHQSAP